MSLKIIELETGNSVQPEVSCYNFNFVHSTCAMLIQTMPDFLTVSIFASLNIGPVLEVVCLSSSSRWIEISEIPLIVLCLCYVIEHYLFILKIAYSFDTTEAFIVRP